jgi:hypothetical protein
MTIGTIGINAASARSLIASLKRIGYQGLQR